MRPPCERVVSYILPAIRAMIVSELQTTYKLKQVDIAKRLNVAQSAISQYSTKTRGSILDLKEYDNKLEDEIKIISNMLVKNEGQETNEKMMNKICSICRSLQCKHFKDMFDKTNIYSGNKTEEIFHQKDEGVIKRRDINE
ncbi:MAG: transcriptional regulator [Promethearchaeota archaeon]